MLPGGSDLMLHPAPPAQILHYTNGFLPRRSPHCEAFPQSKITDGGDDL